MNTDIDELRRLRRARDRMDREYAQPLDVPALARTALMSPAHFNRRFREAYSETPYSYLMTRRIERAKALLRREESIKDSLAKCAIPSARSAVVGEMHPVTQRGPDTTRWPSSETYQGGHAGLVLPRWADQHLRGNAEIHASGSLPRSRSYLRQKGVSRIAASSRLHRIIQQA